VALISINLGFINLCQFLYWMGVIWRSICRSGAPQAGQPRGQEWAFRTGLAWCGLDADRHGQ
jgi:hypothetical protein